VALAFAGLQRGDRPVTWASGSNRWAELPGYNAYQPLQVGRQGASASGRALSIRFAAARRLAISIAS